MGRAGEYVKNLSGEAEYKSFCPAPLPPLLEMDADMITALIGATKALATLEDVLDPLVEQNANQNVSDVINYIKATEFALNRLETLPLCNRLIKETHAVLMEGVRGQEKSPGEFRISQNWIGAAGSTLKNARYIPPRPEDMQKAMSDLEKYIHSDDTLDILIQAALLHYQFETIHPFLDGNGRVGRLLITLFLIEKKALKTPAPVSYTHLDVYKRQV